MGYIVHSAIIVTSEFPSIVAAHDRAEAIFPWVSCVSPAAVNGSRSFFIPPDGSKEGWPESDEGDQQRAEFIEYLRAQAYPDGSSCLDWIEIQFGGDMRGAARIQTREDQNGRSRDIPPPVFPPNSDSMQ